MQQLQRKLQEAEDRLEVVKTSNRELNARIVSAFLLMHTSRFSESVTQQLGCVNLLVLPCGTRQLVWSVSASLDPLLFQDVLDPSLAAGSSEV